MLNIVSLTKPLLNKEGLANPTYESNKHHTMNYQRKQLIFQQLCSFMLLSNTGIYAFQYVFECTNIVNACVVITGVVNLVIQDELNNHAILSVSMVVFPIQEPGVFIMLSRNKSRSTKMTAQQCKAFTNKSYNFLLLKLFPEFH